MAWVRAVAARALVEVEMGPVVAEMEAAGVAMGVVEEVRVMEANEELRSAGQGGVGETVAAETVLAEVEMGEEAVGMEAVALVGARAGVEAIGVTVAIRGRCL